MERCDRVGAAYAVRLQSVVGAADRCARRTIELTGRRDERRPGVAATQHAELGSDRPARRRPATGSTVRHEEFLGPYRCAARRSARAELDPDLAGRSHVRDGDRHAPPDILHDRDLPSCCTASRPAAGKRIRPSMCFWGWLAAGGAAGTTGGPEAHCGPRRRGAGAAARLRPDPRRRDGRVGLPPRPAVGARPGGPAAPALAGARRRPAVRREHRGAGRRPGPRRGRPSGRRAARPACGGSGGCWSSSWSTARAATSSAPRPVAAISLMPGRSPG